MGQQPCLWKDFNLKFVAARTDEDDQPLYSLDLEHLLQVLSLKRFQSLQSLQVKAETWGGLSLLVDFANLLHIVRDKHPTIKKLSLDISTNGSEDEITQLAEELVMFQEVDLAKCEFESGGFRDSIFNMFRNSTFLRALLTASAGPTSKLKILTICDLPKDLATFYGFKPLKETCSEALDEARGRVKVNIVDRSYSDDDDDSDDDDEDSYDDDDDNYDFHVDTTDNSEIDD